MEEKKTPITTIEPPPPTTTEAPPPPPTSTQAPPAFLPEIARQKCFKKGDIPKEMIINFRLYDDAINNFCSQSFTWEEFNKPANGEPGNDAHVEQG